MSKFLLYVSSIFVLILQPLSSSEEYEEVPQELSMIESDTSEMLEEAEEIPTEEESATTEENTEEGKVIEPEGIDAEETEPKETEPQDEISQAQQDANAAEEAELREVGVGEEPIEE